MKKWMIVVVTMFFIGGCTQQNKGTTFVATVQHVVDGDTVKIRKDGELVTVRLLNIDTPETYREKQAYGEEAKQFAKDVLLHQRVIVELSEKPSPYDRYGRLLAYIWIDEQTLYQELIVKEGLARVAYVFEPDTKYVERLYRAQEQAKKAKKRIWSVDGYVTEKGFNMSVWLDEAS
ncbi:MULTISPECIES: thermonuclease family protein [Anoxybacillus]|jgi:micrococcal nuclease|uniref:Nuclease of thermonuclease n=1 Tax=Anoxybacillus flavithermus AK1 TaxID=1297581 RepID=M8DQ48_9BACL|nr:MULTISPECIES: thermonuclease family protein [Anoxybacillus]EMT46570.1 nuclease of thermonuclease [Anoxybacillus flavithermus AK1]MBW7651509.1 thermonuclease family protein [Anoxybacillus sp. ST4]